MKKLNFETLLSIVMWDYNRDPLTEESLSLDIFCEKYGNVMGEHYYKKYIFEFDGSILKMIGYFRGENKEGQIFCDMVTDCIEKYQQRMSERNKTNK